jgi:hypothetical protein
MILVIICSIGIKQQSLTHYAGYQGRIQGGGAHPARAPPKIGKKRKIGCKIVIFHMKYPKNFRTSLRNWKKYDFLALNRDFSHEIPQNFRTSLHSAQFFLSVPPP